MIKSESCDYPTQPAVLASEEAHPRFKDYVKYRSAMASQLVRGDNFTRWLESALRAENGFETVFEALPTSRLGAGWFKNVFGPNNKLKVCLGPFATKEIAEQAVANSTN